MLCERCSCALEGLVIEIWQGEIVFERLMDALVNYIDYATLWQGAEQSIASALTSLKSHYNSPSSKQSGVEEYGIFQSHPSKHNEILFE